MAHSTVPFARAAGDAGETVTITAQGCRFEVLFSEPVSDDLRQVTVRWISDSAKAVATYLERFPVERVRLRIRLKGGRGASNGTTYGWDGALITIALGRETRDVDLADDWLMTHEMLHIGFPSVPERHHWIEEGISTYVEPIARCRAGLKTPEAMWRELMDGLPQGLPEKGDRGLDHTPTWGRTYWGGALFCLLADVEIRKRTENRHGLEHAVRSILRAGGTIQHEWELSRVLAIGDRATGTTALEQLYQQHRATAVDVDLDALWRELGVVRRGRGVVFDDAAPAADVRKAITDGNPK